MRSEERGGASVAVGGACGRAGARIALVVVLAVALATTAVAHDLFIVLDGFFVEPEQRVRVALFNGTFAESESSLTADRVTALVLAGPAEARRLDTARASWDASSETTRFQIDVGATGTYALGVSTAPRLIELDGPSFNEYLEHDGIPDVLEARRLAGELDVAVTERYSKHVKAVLQAGTEAAGGWDHVMDFPAEIVPLRNPYRVEVGDELVVRCLVDDEPVANQLVLAGGTDSAGLFEEHSTRTDPAGEAVVRVDRAGRWYVKFIHMVQVDEEAVDYESKWATLTFEVR